MPSTASTIAEGGGTTQDVNVVNAPEVEVKNDVGNPIPTTIPLPVPITDNSGSLTIDGSVSVSNFPVTQPVSGTIALSQNGTDNDVNISGNVTVIQGTGANLHVVVDSAPTTAVTGTFFQSTQPVSTSTLPLPNGASTETTLALIKAKTDNLDVLLSTRTKPTDSQAVSFGPSLISTSKNPGWAIGTIGYFQTGAFGISKGLLLSLTNTPNFIKSLMTSGGLQGIL